MPVELIGSVLPSNLEPGTVCLIEAKKSNRPTPKYGSFLFLVSSMVVDGVTLVVDRSIELDRAKALMPGLSNLKELRLIIEVSILYNNVPAELSTDLNPTWGSMLPYVCYNREMVESLAINKMIKLELGIAPGLPAKRLGSFLETPEQTRARFTRPSHDGSNFSFVCKSRANEITDLLIMGDLSPALEMELTGIDNGRISALEGREILVGAKKVNSFVPLSRTLLASI
jgi:hypothetical protein